MRRLGLKVSCSPNGWKGEVGKVLLLQSGVMEALKKAIEKVKTEFSKLGVCAALLVAPDGMVTHAVALGGEIYDDIPPAVAEIRGAGDDVFLATGNCKQSSMVCAKRLGIPRDFVLYDADPKEKKDLVKRLKSYYGAVIMVGNDINDIDAMAEAEVGVLLRRGDSPPVNGVEERPEIDFIVSSMGEVIKIVEMVKKPLLHSTARGTRDACGAGPKKSRPPTL